MKRTVSAPRADLAPPVQWEVYEAFAREALAALSAGDSPEAKALREQLADVSFIEMDYTGGGFFLTLGVGSNAPRLDRSGVIGDVHAEAAGYEAPLGLLLFIEDGIARTLEAFAYSDWPRDLGAFRFRYVRWEPNSDGSGASAVNVTQRDADSMWSG